MWASIYFTDSLPPLLTANILLDVAPVLDLDQVAFIMAPSLRIQALKIGETLVPLAKAWSGRFDGLILAHLAPFVDLVADRGGVTRRVLWSNAGNVFEAFSRKLESIAAGQVGLEHARKLLSSQTFSTGKRNPLFEPVRYMNGRRIRRVCCMRYLIPNEKICGVCHSPVTIRLAAWNLVCQDDRLQVGSRRCAVKIIERGAEIRRLSR